MAAQARPSIPSWQERTFDMRSLRRLAIWGASATVALTVAVVAGYSEGGSRRAMVASGGPSNAQKADGRGARLDFHPPEAEAHTRRLAGPVRVLSPHREHLSAR